MRRGVGGRAAGRTARIEVARGRCLRAVRGIPDRFADLPEGSDGEPLRALSAYLASHPTRLDYADRLARGRSIGIGMVEGAIKQLVNRRMKRTGARWLAEHVGPLVELVALADQPEWHQLWAA